ncbi:hypothetical protein WJX74_001422 [Apatococcus lobatus]|uniref:Exonuclease domain-containing protein n=1 Tax=Apatococcus lobatus TaxID=904363 RepID=A0AAW1RNT5_9CHLO
MSPGRKTTSGASREEGELDEEAPDSVATFKCRSADVEHGQKLSVSSPAAAVRQAPSSSSITGKKRKLAQKLPPGPLNQFVDIYGPEAHAEVQLAANTRVRVADVRDLVMWVLADGSNPSWAFIKNKALLSKVALIGLPGIYQDLLANRQEIKAQLVESMGEPTTMLVNHPCLRPSQTVGTLFSVPARKKRKTAATQERKSGKKGAFPPSFYIMTLEAMEACNFPLPQVGPDGEMSCPEGFSATQPSSPAEAGVHAERMVAVDCEMCCTAEGLELCRATLVDDSGQVLMDEYCVPNNPITDYNTRFSGISAETLEGVTNRLADIQRMFCQHVQAETLLVGHGLENDLAALKMTHARNIDTSIIFPHPRGPPFKPALRVLASKFLKRTIQTGSHDSEIDARTTMDLAQLKIKHGPAYGTKQEAGLDSNCERLMEVLGEFKRRCILVDRQDVLSRHVSGCASAVVCYNDEDACSRAAKALQSSTNDFVWTQLRELSACWEDRLVQRRSLQAIVPEPAAPFRPTREEPSSSTEKANGLKSSPAPPAASSAFKAKAAASSPASSATPAAHDSSSPSQPAAKRRALDMNGKPAACSHGKIHADVSTLAVPDAPAAGHQQAACNSMEDAAHAAGRGSQPRSSAADFPSSWSADVQQDGDGDGQQQQQHQQECTPNHGNEPAGCRDDSGKDAWTEEAHVDCILQRLVGRVKLLVDAAPPNTLLLMTTCQGNTAKCRWLQEQKYKRQQGLEGCEPWTVNDENFLSATNAKMSQAFVFCRVKL